MLRPVVMKKIRIVTMKEFKDDVLKKLHTLGVVQIIEHEKTEEENLKFMPADSVLKETSGQLRGLNAILEVYKEVKPEHSESILKRYFNPAPPKQIELGALKEAKKKEIIERARKIRAEVEEEIGESLKQYRATEKEINGLELSKEDLVRLKDLDIELRYVGEGIRIHASVGTCPEEALEAIIADLEEITSGLYYFDKAEITKEGKEEEKEYACIFTCFNEPAEEVSARLRRVGFEKIEVKGFEKLPKEEIKEIAKKIEEKEREREEIKEILAENADRREGDFLTYRELLRAIEERANIQRNFVETERAFSLTGWVPAEKEEKVFKEINRASEGLCVVDAVSPEPDEEKVPILLKNPKFFKSFELFTKLYGIPRYGGIDPTIPFTITFIFFSAFMLGDAIYGLICAIFGLLLLRGAGKYDGTIKDFSIIFISFGVASFVMGALTGGWLGDLFSERHFNIEALKSIMIADQLNDVLKFLIFSIIIGIIHINAGILISKYESRRNLKEFIGGDFWFLVAEIGFIPLFMNYMSYGTWFRHDTPCLIGVGVLAISFALLLYARKGMSLFAITGFLGDTLSYARLMALGLCTYGIALAINVLAALCYGIAYIGIVAAALIFVIGHLVNWVLQVLGSFVHGLRLHYVEFFSKFYITGDYEDEYKPFELKIKV